jgi:hypothetical protein
LGSHFHQNLNFRIRPTLAPRHGWSPPETALSTGTQQNLTELNAWHSISINKPS